MTNRRPRMPPPWRSPHTPEGKAETTRAIVDAQSQGLADGTLQPCPVCGQIKAVGAALAQHLRGHEQKKRR